MGLVVSKWGISMMDVVWIQQSLPFNKHSFGFKDLVRLNTIREPLLILCCCCYWFNYRFLNQKLQTVGLTKSQGLGMQKQIQGTDELQMWTGFRGFNRLSRVCQVTQAFLLAGCAWAQLFLCICYLFETLVTSARASGIQTSNYCVQQLKKPHTSLGLLYTIYKTKQMKIIFLISNPWSPPRVFKTARCSQFKKPNNTTAFL